MEIEVKAKLAIYEYFATMGTRPSVDDIAVRVVPTPNGSRIDIRSKSRVGRSDIGTNARRIRAYAERLK